MSRALFRTAIVVGAVVSAVTLFQATSDRGHPSRSVHAAPALENDISPLSRRPVRPSGRAAAPYVADRARAIGDPAFAEPTIVGVQGYGFEEDIRLDPTTFQNGPLRIYTSTPNSLSSNTSWIWHSEDGGKTFKWVRGAISGTSPITPGKPLAPGACPGGGDTELGVDSAGHLYFNDLTLANFSVYRSDDQGTTFTCNTFGVPDTAVDRQWYAIDGDPVNASQAAPSVNSMYLANDEIGPGAPMCGNSVGNNVLVMYRSPAAGGPGATAGLTFGPRQTVTQIDTCDEGIMGNNEVSPVATTLNDANPGQPLATAVRHVFVVHDNASFDAIAMGRCTPVLVTTDPSGLQCTDHLISSFASDNIRHTGANFPTMAIDAAGTLYAVWEQAPTIPGPHVGNSALMYSYSADEGNTWSTPAPIPMPGLNNAVFAWIAAGDAGRVDVQFVGTSANVNPANATCPEGPDSIDGFWSLYMVQSLSADSATPSWTAPIDAVGHHIHRGSIQTVLGGQCMSSDRTLGDFFQLRVGPQGEANMSYADSNNIDEVFAPHAMYVRQSGGNSLLTSVGTVSLPAAPINSVSDVSGDGIYEAAGMVSSNLTDEDIVASSITRPLPANCFPASTPCYRVTMTLNDISAVPPFPLPDPDTYLQWMTQWLVPADPTCVSGASCVNGGANFMVYMEEDPAGDLTCWDGENAAISNVGGITLTYPGVNQIMDANACKLTPGANGTITIDVPIADVSLAGGVAPLNPNRLYSVTASTTTSVASFSSVAPLAGIGGVLFNLLDVAPGYDAVFGATAVTVSRFAARRAAHGVNVEWRTASETGVAGFNVWRKSPGRAAARVNNTVIRARHSADGRGGSYRFVDRSSRSGTSYSYRLQVVGLDGTRRWYGRAADVH